MATRDFSLIQETNVAKYLGGHRTPNSGATSFTKGDVIAGNFLIECKTKTTEANAFSIQKSWLETLDKERCEMGKPECALAFSFDVGKHSYYVIDERLMRKLVKLMNTDEI